VTRRTVRAWIRILALALGAAPWIPGPPPAAADEPAPDVDPDLRASLDLSYLYGPVAGTLQTPSGGVPGSTSPDRPSLEEIGIDDAHIFDGSLSLGWRDSEIYAGGQLVRLSGDATLDEDLVSQGTAFPAGSPVDADVKLDWYRVGYQHRFSLLDEGAGSELLFRPRAGFALLDYRFELGGPASAKVDRSFFKGAPQLGAAIEWRATRAIAAAGGVLVSIPIEGVPMILAAEVVAKWRAIRDEAFELSLVLGVAYERIAYDDRYKQDVPNDIDVDLGPLLRAGVEVAF
jgi:hypothetical protein